MVGFRSSKVRGLIELIPFLIVESKYSSRHGGLRGRI